MQIVYVSWEFYMLSKQRDKADTMLLMRNCTKHWNSVRVKRARMALPPYRENNTAPPNKQDTRQHTYSLFKETKKEEYLKNWIYI